MINHVTSLTYVYCRAMRFGVVGIAQNCFSTPCAFPPSFGAGVFLFSPHASRVATEKTVATSSDALLQFSGFFGALR